jgi:hypothetical protein
MDREGILYRESITSSVFLGGDALWVADGDFSRARDLLRREAQSFAAKAREAWELEWSSEHHGSYSHWLWDRFRRNPLEMTIRLLLLTVVVGLMIVWPAMYVLRKAI